MIGRGDDLTVQGADISEYLRRHHKLAVFCDYLRYPDFAAAFLSAKRRQRCGNVGVPVVYDGSEPIAFGRPCFWKAGIAARVLQNELRVETVEVQGLDEEEELLDEIESAESASFKVVYHQSYGARKDQEDRYMCKEYLDGISYISFFGVYDGHGGAEAAEYLHQHLHINFAEALRSGRRPYRGRLAQALRTAFRRTDEALLSYCRSKETANTCKEESSGAAAVVAILMGKKLVVAHVGDCRAVLCRERSSNSSDRSSPFECVELTADHKFSNTRERERVQRGGGSWAYNRLNSILEVSRAFGDYDFRAQCKHRGLSADPEITEHTIEPGDEFLVIASDGLWADDPGLRWATGRGFGSSKEAVQYIRRQLRTNDNDADKTVESVVEEAVKCDESDNTTAILITFKPLEQEPPEPVKEIIFSKERPRFFNSNKPRPPPEAVPPSVPARPV